MKKEQKEKQQELKYSLVEDYFYKEPPKKKRKPDYSSLRQVKRPENYDEV